MQREPHVLLWDICHAADAVAAFTRGKALADYKENLFLRSAVERQLIILGEAVVQLSKLTPELADRIPERGAIISFRNLLIHGYAAVVDEIVWEVVENDLPALRSSAARLIEELTPGT